jgi:phosphomannomutase
MSDLRTFAQHWMETDPDPQTRAATLAILDDPAALQECFGARLDFGTAGLRGALGPGPNRMNRALVRRVAMSLADYLVRTVPGCREAGLVIGRDGRHGSREFSEDTASMFAERGFRVWMHDEVVPTPRLGHSVTALGAAAGVMVTASHNPPQDNGYKVYGADGGQILPPHDTEIAALLEENLNADVREIAEFEPLRRSGRIRSVPDEVTDAYFQRIAALRVHTGANLRIVYTAMHGVGTASVVRALRSAGYTDLHVVAQQAEPDGDFPTVNFPNPEEPGALDLALALARSVQADLVVANDPDADRLAVAVPDGSGGYRPLTGNQVGCLLADDLLTHGPSGPGRLVATTIVSSRLLSRIAQAHGAAYAETLTGFKWIAAAAMRHEATGGRFVLGYEEALGYSAGDVVRDKDGVSAVLLFADLAAWCKVQGVSVLEHLQGLYRKHGLHTALQKSLKMPGSQGVASIRAAMAALRANPPSNLGGQPIVRRTDLRAGRTWDLGAGTETAVDLPSSDVLAFILEDGSSLLARPSGTEPKIKFYAEVRTPLDAGDDLAAAETFALERAERLVEELVARAGLG